MVFAKFLKNLAGQCYGINENFANFHPHVCMGSQGTFRGPGDWRNLLFTPVVYSLWAKKIIKIPDLNCRIKPTRAPPATSITKEASPWHGHHNSFCGRNADMHTGCFWCPSVWLPDTGHYCSVATKRCHYLITYRFWEVIDFLDTTFVYEERYHYSIKYIRGAECQWFGKARYYHSECLSRFSFVLSLMLFFGTPKNLGVGCYVYGHGLNCLTILHITTTNEIFIIPAVIIWPISQWKTQRYHEDTVMYIKQEIFLCLNK